MQTPKKIYWADMDDDDPEELGWASASIPVTISKHGVRVKPKPSYVPPHLRDKNEPPSNNKK